MLFLATTLVAIEHELAHALVSAKRGYRLTKILLMPYGAVIEGDLEGLSAKDEIAVALAGPLCNLCTAVFFLALWWLYPSLYPYTDLAFDASFSMFLVNLIPAYPLDGGRVLYCLMKQWKIKRKKQWARGISLAIASAFLGAFIVFLLQGRVQISLCVMGIFLLCGQFGGKEYERAPFSMEKELTRGVEEKRVAIFYGCTLSKAVRFLEQGKYLWLDLYDEQERLVGSISQNRLSELFLREDLSKRMQEFIAL